MARPQKEGIDYFPLDVDFFTGNKKIKILKARYGADGITLYLYLLCEIYRRGYYLKLDEDYDYIISDDLNMSTEKIGQIIEFLLGRSLFDNKLFRSDTVLTSRSIQRHYQLAIKERAKKKSVEIKRFWLLTKEETETFIKVNSFEDKSEINGSKSGNNHNKSQEESLKESRVKESILKESGKRFIPPSIKEVKSYCNERNNNIDPERFVNFYESKGWMVGKNKMKDWKAAIRSWETKDKENNAPAKKVVPAPNKFHNFDQRTYDYDQIENQLMKKQMEIKKEDR